MGLISIYILLYLLRKIEWMVLLCFRTNYFAPQKLEFYVSEMKQVNQKY